MDSAELLALAKRRGILFPAYEIYGGLRGFYEYGPLGARLKENILSVWRRYYVLGEGFLEIESPSISPEEVFRASGHLEEFTDILVQCNKCGEQYRADHLLTEHPNPDSLTIGEIKKLLGNVRCEKCGGEIGAPELFNLMFSTTVGAGSGGRKAYLRPETAQGMFVNFSLLYRFAREKMPFGVVQVGRGFRNEISPRQGVIRLREFNMAEAEVFIDPRDKSWPRFKYVAGDKLRLVPENGTEVEVAAKEAVQQKIIGSESLAYFIAITKRFLLDIGIDVERVRFRRHLEGEQAHYAQECWDAEVATSLGWIECVGIADRGTYDLSRHIEFSGSELKAFRPFKEARVREVVNIVPNMSVLGRLYRSKAKEIARKLSEMETIKEPVVVKVEGEYISLSPECYSIEKRVERVQGEKYIPAVIEPSYGIDRIIYALLEHSAREKEGRICLRLKPHIAPIFVGVFPLMPKDGLDERARRIDENLRNAGFHTFYDESGSIGRRYARMDEIGTPFCITVDYDTLKDGTVTIRERETSEQVRVGETSLVKRLRELMHGLPFHSLK